MARELVYENKINYLNGVVWGNNNCSFISNVRDNNHNNTRSECMDLNVAKKLHMEIEACNYYTDEILEKFNCFRQICKKNNKIFSAMIFSKYRMIEWTDKKYKNEKEKIIRLALTGDRREQLYVDIPFIKLKNDINERLITAFNTIYFDDIYEKETLKEDKIDVVLSPRAAGYFIHEIIGHPLEIDFVTNRQSLYTINDLGKNIFPENINIVEKPSEIEKLGMYFGDYDDSGEVLKDKIIVQNGTLRNFIEYQRCDKITNICIPRMYNLCLLSNNGKKNYFEILSDIDFGLAIDSIVYGNFNYITKKYLLYCGQTRIIRNGKAVGFLDGLIIEDDIETLKENITEIGNDAECTLGECSKMGQVVKVGMTSPSIKISQVCVRTGG